MATPFIGEIVMFAGNFAPRGWAFCNGQILSISQNTALFSILGTTYGGNGQTTFALPDLRGRSAVHAGGSAGPGLTARPLGSAHGAETHTLTQNEMPAHAHTATNPAVSANGNSNRPASNRAPARGGSYGTGADTTLQGPQIGGAGGSQPHDNLGPRLAVNYIIALEGIFPSRN